MVLSNFIHKNADLLNVRIDRRTKGLYSSAINIQFNVWHYVREDTKRMLRLWTRMS